MERIIELERILSGGFAGGVSTGPQSVAPGNELIDLANALGDFTGDFSRAAQTWHGNDQERKRINIGIQKKEAQEASAQIIQNELAGYTAKQMGDALASEPMAKRFAENPYILPAVQIHRGRKAADEANQAMTEAGVDIRNPEAVRQWTKDNIPKSDDPFFSQGFNEQWERWGSQHAQMQFKELAEAAEADRQAMGSTEWDNAFADSVGLPALDRVANAFEELNAMSGLSGAEKTDIQMTKLRRAAEIGDVEVAEAIANLQRGDAPSLLADARLGGQAQAYIEAARTEHLQRREGLHVETQTKLWDMIDTGITIPKLEETPEYLLLKQEDPEKQASIDRYIRSRIEQKRVEAQRAYAAAQRGAAEQGLIVSAARAIMSGQGEFITSFYRDYGDAGSFSMSAGEQRERGLEALRVSIFPEGFQNIGPDRGEVIRNYTRALADSNMKDSQLAGYLQGATAYLTPEGIQQLLGGSTPEAKADGVRYLKGVYNIYKHMDPTIAVQYFSDAKQTAVFATMDRLIQQDPDLPVDQAATRAVALTAQRATFDGPPRDVAEALKNFRIKDPVAGTSVPVPADAIQGRMMERVLDLMTAGMPRAEAIPQARREMEGSFVAVHGKAVALPNDPDVPRETPERWARTVTAALEHTAESFGGEAKDYTIKHLYGEVYVITKPDGTTIPTTANEVREVAMHRLAKAEADTEAARRAAAEAATPRRTR